MPEAKPTFEHFDLYLIDPPFSSQLATHVVALEQLRHAPIATTTPALIFDQIRELFHLAESVGSARIEGNHTTMTDYVQTQLEGNATELQSEQIKEIANIEQALKFIESHVKQGEPITHGLVREIHKIVVEGLTKEGDKNPGMYRNHSVSIKGSFHLPPNHSSVKGYMDELLSFVNKTTERKYELIKVAQAHHRFSWVHPFANGNGRVVRLFTYAMLIHFGFDVKAKGRILNPTAIFCVNRDAYYNMLSYGDKGTPKGLSRWCEYVLSGLLIELKHINNLANFDYLKSNIIFPALNKATQQGVIDDLQHKILIAGVKNGELKRNLLLEEIKLSPNQMTYQLTKLIEGGLISPIRENSRSYTPNINKSLITRWVIQALYEQGFMDRIA